MHLITLVVAIVVALRVNKWLDKPSGGGSLRPFWSGAMIGTVLFVGLVVLGWVVGPQQ